MAEVGVISYQPNILKVIFTYQDKLSALTDEALVHEWIDVDDRQRARLREQKLDWIAKAAIAFEVKRRGKQRENKEIPWQQAIKDFCDQAGIASERQFYRLAQAYEHWFWVDPEAKGDVWAEQTARAAFAASAAMELSSSHFIAALPSPNKEALIQQAVKEGWSVEKLEERAGQRPVKVAEFSAVPYWSEELAGWIVSDEQWTLLCPPEAGRQLITVRVYLSEDEETRQEDGGERTQPETASETAAS